MHPVDACIARGRHRALVHHGARDASTGIGGIARHHINMGPLSEDSMKRGDSCLHGLRERHARLDFSKQIRPRIRHRGQSVV